MVYLGLGSNLGDLKKNLITACQAFDVRNKSSIYETEPVGYLDQSWFLNMVIEIESDDTPHQLLLYCQSVETKMGRIREIPKGPRTIDIDILFYDELVIQERNLIIPHPEIPNRRFVLEPLNEIAPAFIHPVMKVSIAELLRRCPDDSAVQKLPGI